jgi:hypothetical protein
VQEKKPHPNLPHRIGKEKEEEKTF